MQRRRLTKREEDPIRGLYANDTRDYQEAARVIRLWQMDYPDDSLALLLHRQAADDARTTDEAIRMMNEARRREPYAHDVLVNLALLHLRAGNLDAVQEPVAALRAVKEEAWAQCVEGLLSFLRGDCDGALARFATLERSGDDELAPRAYSWGSGHADSGRTEDALAALETGIEEDVAAGRRVEQAEQAAACRDTGAPARPATGLPLFMRAD